MKQPYNSATNVSFFPGASMLACLLSLTFSVAQADALPVLDCLIEPDMVIEVATPVSGRIQAIHVRKSDAVEKDQLLVELEDSVPRAAMEEARARAAMGGDIQAKKATLNHALRMQKRQDGLVKSGAISPQEADDVDAQVILARSELSQAKDAKALAELEFKRSIEVLNQHSIRSPIRGVVVERYKSPGESVEGDAILKLAQLDPLRVEIIVPAHLFGQIQTGMQAMVHPEAPAGSHYTATVSIVDRMVDAASGTFSVRLDLPNPDYQLPGGLKCTVEFITENTEADIPPAPTEPAITTPSTEATVVTEPVPPVAVAPQADTLASAHPGDAPDVATQCFSLGPISDVQQAAYLAAELHAEGYAVEVSETIEHRADNYLVLIPRADSRRAARETAGRLDAAGETDYIILAKHSISMGYYPTLAFAEDRQQELAALGFQTEIKALGGSQSTHYRLAVRTASGPAAGAIPLADRDFAFGQAETVACPPAAE